MREAEDKVLQHERLAAIGEMAAGIAHESRNALQRIQAAVELLRMDSTQNTDFLSSLARIERAADDIGELLEEVRSYAAPITLDRMPCELSDIWRKAWDDIVLTGNGVLSLTEDLDDANLQCDVDRFRLGQVFRNVFENAIGACEESQL